MFQEVPHDIGVFTEEIHQPPVGTESGTLGDRLFKRRSPEFPAC